MVGGVVSLWTPLSNVPVLSLPRDLAPIYFYMWAMTGSLPINLAFASGSNLNSFFAVTVSYENVCLYLC